MTLYQFADDASTYLNPALLLLLLEEPLLRPASESAGQKARRVALFWLLSAVSIAAAVLVTKTSKHQQWWHGHPNFPSGHMTLACAAGYCLIRQRGRRWAWLVVPLAALMGWSLAYGGWHTPVEVLGALVPGLGVPAAVWGLASLPRRRPRPGRGSV